MEAPILDPRTLLQLAQDKTEKGRLQLADAVTQFFDGRDLGDSEQRLATEILLNLVRQAEIDLREALSVKLSARENVPADVIRFLANDTISVARPVLQHSPLLKDNDLIYIIAQKGEEYWRSIASRAQISPVITDRLIDTGDIGTAKTLVENPHITLPKKSVKKLVKVSLTAEELQVSLLRRPEIDPETAGDLYMCVGHALRQEIAHRFKMSADVIETAMEGLIEELSLEAHGILRITPEMETLARRMNERGCISADLMIKTLRKGQMSFFVALFAERVGLPSDGILTLVNREGGREFALACRALHMMKSEFASIFLLSRGLRTGEKIVNQKELITALNHYDTVRDFDIQRTLKAWARDPAMI